MKKEFKYTINQGLPGGPNELKKFIKGSISVTGYKSDSPDVNNDFNIIPSNNITMQGVNFPVLGIDNLGNKQMMMPGGEYTFPGSMVYEKPMMKKGGVFLGKSIKCSNCGHSYKAADGGKDPLTCHKCGSIIKMQMGGTTEPFNYNNELPEMGKGGLTQWFDEKWVDVKTGKTCGRSGKDKNSRPYPACRPSKRVNETTPKTASELSSSEKAKFKREKTSGQRISYNHKRKELGGEAGWLNKYQVGGLFPVGPYDEMMAPKEGNYLLPDINRPYYIDDEGQKRSEYRAGFNIKGKETLIPTVVGGRQLSDAEALAQFKRTGLHMGQYNTIKDADYASEMRTAKYNMLEDPVRFQMQIGGATPIYVSDRNDPRLRSYNDSLNLYNKGVKPNEINTVFNEIKNNSDLRYYRKASKKELNQYPGKIKPTAATKFETDRWMKDKSNNPNLQYAYYPVFDNRGNLMPNAMAVMEAYKKPVQPIKYADPKIVAKQQQLIDAGYNIGTADGIWGSKSQEAFNQMNASKQSNVDTSFNNSFNTPTMPVGSMTEENIDALKRQYKENTGSDFKSKDEIGNNLQKSLGRRPTVAEYNKAIQQYNTSINSMQYGGWLNQYQIGGEKSTEQNPEQMQGVNIQAPQRSWFDRNIERPLRKFGRSYAQRISDATGGSEWYKQANPFMNLAFEAMNAPQYTATYAATGKVQTPSEAMDIQNPYLAFLVDAGLDPVGASATAKGLMNLGRNLPKKLMRSAEIPKVLPGSPNAAASLDDVAPNLVSSQTIKNLISSQINKNPRLALSLQKGRLIQSIDNVTVSPGLRLEDVKALKDWDYSKVKKGDITDRDFFEGLNRGSQSLNNSLKRRINDLVSREGFNRLVNQEKEVLIAQGRNPDVIENLAKLNAKARIEELANTTNINKKAFEYSFMNSPGDLNNEFVKNKSLYDNAFFNSEYNEPKNTPYYFGPENYSQPKPGGIAMGYNFVNNKPIEMHEIAHALQRGRILPIDNEIRNTISPKTSLNRGESNTYGYFRTFMEPSAFANELRESMFQKGFIPDYYSPINEKQVQDAYKYFKKNPMGLYDPKDGSFLSNTRIFDFMQPSKENSKSLTDILNKLPAAAPIVGGVGASQMQEKKYGGWLDQYQIGGELPELNSKMDVANFYKNPLSEKYGISQNSDSGSFEYYLKSGEAPATNKNSIKEELKEVKSQNLKKAYIPSLSNDMNRMSDVVLPEVKQTQARQRNIENTVELERQRQRDFIDSQIYNQPSDIQLDPTSLSLPEIKEQRKAVQRKTFASSYEPTSFWETADLAKEILERQKLDNTYYGKFDERGDDVLNRTDVGRNKDSEMFLADYTKPNSVIIDIGSALGNNNPKLAGVSVYELTQNPLLKQKNVKVIATDIPSEVKGFEELKKKNNVYPIDYAEVPLTFNTPVRDVLKTKGLENAENVYLRAANSIDLLMNPQETKEHFDYISKNLKDKNVTYLYNNVILNKPAGTTKFKKIGNLENTAFDHRKPSWKNKQSTSPYKLVDYNFKTGGQTNWLDNYK